MYQAIALVMVNLAAASVLFCLKGVNDAGGRVVTMVAAAARPRRTPLAMDAYPLLASHHPAKSGTWHAWPCAELLFFLQGTVAAVWLATSSTLPMQNRLLLTGWPQAPCWRRG